MTRVNFLPLINCQSHPFSGSQPTNTFWTITKTATTTTGVTVLTTLSRYTRNGENVSYTPSGSRFTSVNSGNTTTIQRQTTAPNTVRRAVGQERSTNGTATTATAIPNGNHAISTNYRGNVSHARNGPTMTCSDLTQWHGGCYATVTRCANATTKNRGSPTTN